MAPFLMLPEETWDVQDDKCDCMFQRIGMWTNPYLGETLEVRMCCIWADLYKMYPQYVRTVPAFLDYNAGDQWDPSIMEWNGEQDMPPALWYRQMARKDNITVAEAREKYADRDEERPRGVPKPPAEQTEEVDFLGAIFSLLQDMSARLDALEQK